MDALKWELLGGIWMEKIFVRCWLGKRRPLNAIEISNISFNMQKTVVKLVLEIAFSQVTHSKDLREYFQRGTALAVTYH
jgi:hypothetical protein